MPKNSPKILIGCDPEIFFKNKKTGKFISAHNLIPGTKNEPFKVPGGAIQVDGVAAEFNVEPCNSVNDWIVRNQVVIAEIQKRAPDIELVYQPTATFTKKYFDTLPDEVKMLGCNPDFNAWTGQLNPSPDANGVYFRTGAGHIHFGWRSKGDPTSEEHRMDCGIVIRHADYFLGMPSLKWDNDAKRRKLYGSAGAMRYKPYGVEYRTLSNSWLQSDALRRWVYTTAYTCMDAVFGGIDLEAEFKNSAQIIINNNIQWWDIKELEKAKDLLPKGVNLKRITQMFSILGVKSPPAPLPASSDKPKKKKDPHHNYSEATAA